MLAISSLAKVQTALDNLKSPLQLSDFICHRHHAVKFSLKMSHILQTLCGIRNQLHLPDQTDRPEFPTADLWAVQDVCCSFYVACEIHRGHTVLLFSGPFHFLLSLFLPPWFPNIPGSPTARPSLLSILPPTTSGLGSGEKP